MVACTISLQAEQAVALNKDLQPWLDIVQGKVASYSLQGSVEPVIDDEPQKIGFKLTRYDDQAFDLEVTHSKYAVIIHRREQVTAFALPKHQVVYLGKGVVDATDHLQARGILERLVSPASTANLIVQSLSTLGAEELVGLLQTFAEIEYSDSEKAWLVDKKHTVRFDANTQSIELDIDGTTGRLQFSTDIATPTDAAQWSGYKVVEIDRVELERQLARGVRRAGEVLAPAASLTSPAMRSKKVEHGELRWIDGQRVCLLAGTPEEIGTAHGQLLKTETQRCIDSVLYAFGTAQTIATGRWFRSDLDAAYQRLSPHIPERHKIETRALAASLGMSPQLLETLNVFPELFHCSGFALFGDATLDGKLYHGRVLDYMTTIGLQDAATTFIVAPKGMIPFANIGYGGFIGSVSGMNAEKISLGEMGGRGEGQWDGVPMATLMRRALEECDSLDEVKQLWSSSPRTCEYYYVFADGETKSAVGVAATPQSIEFVEPGAFHERLGEGIKDAVVLSAGSRLEELRRRVQESYGKVDADAAMQLMCRPVAMKSNLHNVLFVPEDGVMYVANASHDQPAADRPYVKLDLGDLLRDAKRLSGQPLSSIQIGDVIPARDSLDLTEDRLSDAEVCLDGLRWQPTDFQVRFEKCPNEHGDMLVRFPTPRPSGNAQNDEVAMEWYQARDAAGQIAMAPAMVVVHESGRGMNVGRLIARTMRSHGIHTFMVQLPYYGVRRPPEGRATGENLIHAIQQAVADVRRAKDAVAAVQVVAPDNINLQGTSLGGFVTATVAGLDRGYRHVFILLAGGDLFGTLMEGKRDAEKVRAELRKTGLSDEAIRSGLNSIEPTRLAHRLDPSRTWLFSGAFDTVVTPRSSKLLAEAAGLDRKHHVEMLANHYSGIVFLPTVAIQMKRIVQE